MEDLGDLVGVGRLDLEDAGRSALRADLVQLLDDFLDGVEFGVADEDGGGCLRYRG